MQNRKSSEGPISFRQLTLNGRYLLMRSLISCSESSEEYIKTPLALSSAHNRQYIESYSCTAMMAVNAGMRNMPVLPNRIECNARLTYTRTQHFIGRKYADDMAAF